MPALHEIYERQREIGVVAAGRSGHAFCVRL